MDCLKKEYSIVTNLIYEYSTFFNFIEFNCSNLYKKSLLHYIETMWQYEFQSACIYKKIIYHKK